jgi:hypothetical protein
MELDPIELGRLAIMQRAPLRYIERRVELLDLSDDYHYGVTVTQQFVVPFHGKRGAASPVAHNLLIPLGQFSKDRIPDMRILGPDGSVLPLLSRALHGKILSTLLTTRWQDAFFGGVSEASRDAAIELWRAIQIAAAQVVTSARPGAHLTIYRLRRYLEEFSKDKEIAKDLRCFLLTILAEDQFWLGLNALAESRLMVAQFAGVPGQRYVVTISHTERFRYTGYASGTPRKLLAWLGLISIPIARSVANLGQAASLWVVQSVPEGLEPLRCFWKKDGKTVHPEDPVSVDVTRAVAGRYEKPGDTSEQDTLLLDVQISPASAIASTIALAAFLLIISTYVYQALPGLRYPSHGEDRTILVGLGSIFAAVPAAIAGALVYKGETFVRRASRGPRVLLAVLSAQAAFFAAVVSLKGLGSLAEAVAYILSIYSLIVIGLFSFIQLGPRWRKSTRSRRKSATALASPVECRKRQIRGALRWLAFWTFVVLVFARSQAVLQHQHFFTHAFPRNVWHAWWSWF